MNHMHRDLFEQEATTNFYGIWHGTCHSSIGSNRIKLERLNEFPLLLLWVSVDRKSLKPKPKSFNFYKSKLAVWFSCFNWGQKFQHIQTPLWRKPRPGGKGRGRNYLSRTEGRRLHSRAWMSPSSPPVCRSCLNNEATLCTKMQTEAWENSFQNQGRYLTNKRYVFVKYLNSINYLNMWNQYTRRKETQSNKDLAVPGFIGRSKFTGIRLGVFQFLVDQNDNLVWSNFPNYSWKIVYKKISMVTASLTGKKKTVWNRVPFS